MKSPGKKHHTDADMGYDFGIGATDAGAVRAAMSLSEQQSAVSSARGPAIGRTLPADGRTYSDKPSDERGWVLGMG